MDAIIVAAIIIIALIFVWFLWIRSPTPQHEGLGYWATPNTTLISACDKNKFRTCNCPNCMWTCGKGNRGECDCPICKQNNCECATAEMLPPRGSPASFMAAHDSNTLEQRPGNRTVIDIYSNNQVPPAYEIRLLYKDVKCKHKLTMLFDYITKIFLSDGTAANANIKFSKELVDETNPYNLYGGFPKIIKIRRNGQVLMYDKGTDFGSLSDWCINEGILF